MRSCVFTLSAAASATTRPPARALRCRPAAARLAKLPLVVTCSSSYLPSTAGNGKASTAGTVGAPYSRGAPGASSYATPTQQRRDAMLQDTRRFLQQELAQLFVTGNLTRARYAPNFTFEDPIARFTDLNGYAFQLQALRALFDVTFDVHSIDLGPGESDLTSRWTMVLQQRLVPWRPRLVFTGRSLYRVDVDGSGKLASQHDVWDALTNNSFPSVEGYQHLLSQLAAVRLTPDLDTPSYTLLRATKAYEVRRYEPYLVAEVAMPATAGPAAGQGFTELAGYIFGGNAARAKMQMTTPVFTTAGQGDLAGGRMQFVMERRLGGEPGALPRPDSDRVQRRRQEGGLVAAAVFSGLPFDWEVTAAEARLRAALAHDGLSAAPGYQLARYNEPFVPPWLRRNEILIAVDGLKL